MCKLSIGTCTTNILYITVMETMQTGENPSALWELIIITHANLTNVSRDKRVHPNTESAYNQWR